MKKRTSLLTNTALHVSEAFTQTGPGYHEGTNGVSVKPSLPVSLAHYPRACQEFLVTFVSQTKVTRPSACAASGAKRCLTYFAQQNRAFNQTLADSQKKQATLLRRYVKRLAHPGQVVLIGGHDFSGRARQLDHRLAVAFGHFYDDVDGFDAGVVGQVGADAE